jgi:hypothetical protein
MLPTDGTERFYIHIQFFTFLPLRIVRHQKDLKYNHRHYYLQKQFFTVAVVGVHTVSET